MQRQTTLRLIGTFAAGLSLASWYFFDIRYFEWRHCSNELGRCYDPDGSGQVYTTAGLVWALPGALFLLVALAVFWIARRRLGEERN